VSGVDYAVFGLYMLGILAVGFYFSRRNHTTEDYYVGGRSLGAGHVGLSIVATDVGGGFSIGLGGVGFAMGLAGSWLLFTGLVGAWLSAVFVIPRIKRIDVDAGMMTYPDFLRSRYREPVALLAALVSAIGYAGFTGGQVLAGAKLAAGTLLPSGALGLTAVQLAILVIGFIIVTYTVLGGLKAVVYTDTIQWIVLLAGLCFLAIPFSLQRIGGWRALRDSLPASYFDVFHIAPIQVVNWFVTIIPIWLVAMTLYQRMFACRDVRSAKRAWYLAGLFEYPVMAFMGVLLGMCARVLFPMVEKEMGLPLLIGEVLPVGIAGIVVASYFSAIMSTADSCLIASSGNLVGDVIQRHFWPRASERALIRLSQGVTLAVGVASVGMAWVAARHGDVLTAILYAYSFMVSALFVPTLGAFFWSRSSTAGAFGGMLAGGGCTLALLAADLELPLGLDPTAFGILVSALVFIVGSLQLPDRRSRPETST
jgi:solute:Na+ symporter, SSS family